MVAYDVAWEDNALGETQVDMEVLIPAMELSRVQRRGRTRKEGGRLSKKFRPGKVFDDNIAKALFQVHEGEDGDPLDSESSGEESDGGLDDDDNEHGEVLKAKTKHPEHGGYIVDVASDEEEDTRFQWRTDQTMPPPRDKSNRGASTIKPESIGVFRTPLSSLLAFVPLKLFKSMVYFSNVYAADSMKKQGRPSIAGSHWMGDC